MANAYQLISIEQVDGLAAALDAAGNTPAEILASLLTVDGPGSGLNADLFDGYNSTDFVFTSSYTAADVLSKLLTVDGASSTLDADLLDGQHGSYYNAWGNLTGAPEYAQAATSASLSLMDTGGTRRVFLYGDGDGQGFLNTTLGGYIFRATAGNPAFTISGNVFINGNGIWHAGNDGAGSTLDADLLDGQHGSWYAPIASPTFTGTVTTPNLTITSGILNGIGSNATVTLNDGVGASLTYSTSRLTVGGPVVFVASSVERFRVNTDGTASFSSGTITANGNAVWHAGNDGAGSALDADLLDGEQGSFYRSASNINAGTLGLSYVPSQLVRSGSTGGTNWNDASSTLNGFSGLLLGTDTNGPGGGVYYHPWTIEYTTSGNITQFALPYSDDSALATGLKYRGRYASTWSSWYTIWGSGNDGAGSGLDADLLDGQHGSYYRDAGNLNAGIILAARMPAHTGDVTSSSASVALTLATVNGNVGSFGSATAAPTFTVNAKGLITAAGSATITPAWGSLTSVPAGVTSLAALTGAGVVTATSTGVLAMRSIGVAGSTEIPDRAAADSRYLTLSGGTLAGYLTLHADPASSMQAATKQYVDTVASGLSPKAACRVSTTAAGGNITLSGTQTIDGVAVVAGNRVLVKNQTSSLQNGIYVCAAGAWSRATDADSWAELVSAFVFVEEGTDLADTGWTCTVNSGGTLGVTAVTWVQFSGSATFTASTGITKSGVDFQLTGQALALHNLATNGSIHRTGSGTYASRTLTAPAAGITVTNGDGVAGNPTLVLANDLAAVEGLATTGIVRRTSTDTWSASALVNADLPASGVSASTYRSVTVNAQGIVTGGTNPTTISGYGITDLLTSILAIDGATSGIDADLLDGQHGSYYRDAGNLNAGTILAARMPALTGDITTTAGAVATTLATVNGNVGSFGSATQVATFTVNAKGLITAAGNTTIALPWSAITSGKPTTLAGYGITDLLTSILAIDGTGSGIDADLFDGHTSDSFSYNRGDFDSSLIDSQVKSGQRVIDYSGLMYSTVLDCIDSTADTGTIQHEYDGTNSWFWRVRNRLNNTTWQPWKYVALTSSAITGTIWHSNNDGASSGLDADLLDGQHGSYYAPISSPTFSGTVTNAGDFDTTNGADRSLTLRSSTSYNWQLRTAGDHFQILEASDAAKIRLAITYPNGYVGIGTASPSDKLHIKAASAPVVRLENDTVTSTSAYQFYSGSTLEGAVSHYAQTAALTISSGRSVAWGGHIVFTTDTVEKMRITSAGLVGIGTASPGSVLELFNATTFNARTSGLNVHRPSSYGQYGSMAYDGDTTYFSSTYTGGGAGAYGAFRFWAYDSTSTPVDRFMIAANGNVGINVTDPAYQLEVAKTTGGTMAVSTAGSAGTTASPLSTTLNFLGFADKIKGAITVEDRETSVWGGWMNFYTRDAADALQKRVTIDSSGYFGIGTAAPSTVLHTYRNSSNATASLLIEEDGTGDASLSFLLTGVIQWSMGLDNSDSDKFKISASSALGTTDYFSIDGSGNVGINTASPGQSFGVNVSREQVFGVDTLGYVTMPHADASGFSALKAASGRGLKLMSGSTSLISLPASLASTLVLGYAALQVGDSSGVGTPIRIFSIGASDLVLRGGDGDVSRVADVIITVKNNVEVARFADTGVVSFANTSVTAAGNAMWHAGNDGAGSTLDADLLDGQQGAWYAPIASPTFTGTPAAPTAAALTNTTQLATTAFVTTAGNLKANIAAPSFTGNGVITSSSGGTATITFTISDTHTATQSTTVPWAAYDFTSADLSGVGAGVRCRIGALSEAASGANTKISFYTAPTTAGTLVEQMSIGSQGPITFTSSTVTAAGNAVWHAGNDGAGSTLDADLLDGQQGAYYFPVSGGSFTGNISIVKASPSITINDTTYVDPSPLGLFRVYSSAGNLYITRNTATNRSYGTESSTVSISSTTGVWNFTSTPLVSGGAVALVASPTFTGTPAAPTATAGTNTTQLATTAFVTTAGNLKANIASPTFTGTPAAPTAAAATSTTQIATTAFVTTADNLKANIASPTFTGTVTMPAFSVTSDQKLKTFIEPLQGYGEFLDATKIYSFIKDGKHQFGVLAHEAQEVRPELVSTVPHDELGEVMTVNPMDYLFALVAEVQDLRKRVAELEGK